MTSLLYKRSGYVLIGILLLVWEMSAQLSWVQSNTWPAFSAVVLATIQGLGTGELLGLLLTTLGRLAAGFAIGCGIGTALGLLAGSFPLLQRFVTPVVEALRPLPSPAIIPPLILFVGVDDALKISVISIATFFPMFISAVGGMRTIDETLVNTSRTLHAGRWRTMMHVMLPACLPSIFAGLRISLGIGLVVTVIAEMISGTGGLGFFIVQTQYAMKPESMYSGVLCLSVTGLLLTRGAMWLEARILHWYWASQRAA